MSNSSELVALFRQHTPLIDVRSPGEFRAGHLPGAVNLPILDDLERHQVGLCYKQEGPAQAIALGHQLVSGENKKRKLEAWINHLKLHPNAQVMCLRGGLRSQISCQWLTEAGIPRTPIQGGYKRLRQFLLSQIETVELPQVIRLGGMTGTGKTSLLQTLPSSIDLEALAQHRGSAFGDCGPQPSQASFESFLGAELIGLSKVVVEDESLQIGVVRLPVRFYEHLQSAPLVILEAPLAERVASIYRDYVQGRDLAFFSTRVQKISKKLGGLRTRELLEEMERAFALPMSLAGHERWITQLLIDYYDPAYQYSLKRQQTKIIFRGDAASVREYLMGCSI